MNQFVTGTRIIHCKVENENYLTNFQSESYIKEEIMIPDIKPFDDEESSAESSNLQTNAFPFERSHKDESKLTYNQDESDLTNIQSETYIKEEIMISDMDENFDDEELSGDAAKSVLEVNEKVYGKLVKDKKKLIHKEQISTQYNINSEKRIDVVNVDKRNKELFVELHKINYISGYNASNNINAENFDQNTIKTNQCGIKIEVNVTSQEESLRHDVTDQSDKRGENDKIYNPKCAKEVGNLQVDTADKDKQNITPDKTKRKISPKPISSPGSSKASSVTNNTAKVVEKDASKTTSKATENKGEKLKSVILICSKCSKKEKVLSVRQTTTCQDCKELMSFMCLTCHDRIKTISSVYYHIRNVCKQQEIYQCEYCSYEGKSKDHFHRHMTRQHSSKQECSKCGKEFTKDSMRIHKEICGINVRYLRCIFCSFDCKYKDNLLKHIRKAHTNIKPHEYSGIIKKIIKAGGRIKANALNLADGSKVDILSRTIDFKKWIQLFCAQCNKVCKNADYGSKRDCEKCGAALIFQCRNCTKHYSKIRSMRSHLHQKCAAWIHFQCTNCDYTSISKKTLQIHINRRHMGLAPKDYERCSKDDMQFKHRHDRINREKHCGRQAELQCHICPFKGKDKSCFDLHMQDHELHPTVDYTTFPAPSDVVRNKNVGNLQVDTTDKDEQNIEKRKTKCKKSQKSTTVFNISSPGSSKASSVTNNTAKVVEKDASITTSKATENNGDKVLNSTDDSEAVMLLRKVDSKKLIQLFCAQCNEICKNADYRSKRDCEKCGAVVLFQCFKCSKLYSKIQSLRSHLHKQCAAKIRFKCATCEYTSTNKRTLQIHISRKHMILASEDYEKCSKCDRQYKIRIDRLNHERRCGRKRELECQLCPFKSKDKFYFNLHMQDHVLQPSVDGAASPAPSDDVRNKSTKRFDHPTNNSPKPMSRKEKMKVQKLMKIFCPKCNKRFKYVKHAKKQCMKCGSEKTYECDKCGKVHSRLYNLSIHVIRCHLDSEFEKHLQCLTCGKRFAFYSVMKRHQKYCKQSDQQCPHCPFKTKYSRNLACHLQKMHSEVNTVVVDEPQKFICAKCGKGYSTASSFSCHKTYYCGKQPSFACDHCKFKAYRKNNLMLHLKSRHIYLFTHQELRCRHCGKDSSNVYTHNIHIANCSTK